MKERPILMSAPMVRAIPAGTKTQTRRIVDCYCNSKHIDRLLGEWSLSRPPFRWDGRDRLDDGDSALWRVQGPHPKPGDWIEHYQTDVDDYATRRVRNPYGEVGDRLWVKETHRYAQHGIVAYRADGQAGAWVNDGGGGRLWIHHGWIVGAADQGREGKWFGESKYGAKWRPSIHMPRWASRITLEIVEVRVERLQDISEADAIAEGIEPAVGSEWRHYGCSTLTCMDPRMSYRTLWESINGKGSWDANPWVWVLCFQRVTP